MNQILGLIGMLTLCSPTYCGDWDIPVEQPPQTWSIPLGDLCWEIPVGEETDAVTASLFLVHWSIPLKGQCDCTDCKCGDACECGLRPAKPTEDKEMTALLSRRLDYIEATKAAKRLRCKIIAVQNLDALEMAQWETKARAAKALFAVAKPGTFDADGAYEIGWNADKGFLAITNEHLKTVEPIMHVGPAYVMPAGGCANGQCYRR